ncbi:peptidylprolyl isomerase [Flavobacterium zhairuonense]|uniref:FKBP-type peptidyl-prolyl cis-trans isomerase n=1 Tax=Flavobacterium zhairuonense TaxID=2493631 RepID=UPI001051ED78|nr:FKBP-type peptidyl-prolyl cis-trans isomerase [Flavobacterium zhairuonense]KAF2509231.1 peptidylprolyl isomerase [Flavobacterium zhairuonense]
MKKLLATLFTLTLFISCSSSDKDLNTTPKDYSAENEKQITDYLAKKNLTAQRSDSGLYYIITEPGTGKQPTATSSVTVAYKGYLTNEKVFDQSVNGATFPLNRVIAGWTEGIPLFKEGGSGVLLIPAHLAYEDKNVGTIPAGSVLIFDVKLISVN